MGAPGSGRISLSLQVPPEVCANTNLIALSNGSSGLSETRYMWQKPYFDDSTGTTGITEFLCDMASDSDVSGVDVTATAVHDSPFEESPSMQVDDFTGVDIPFDPQESRDVQGYLESWNRSPTTRSPVPRTRKSRMSILRFRATPHIWAHRRRSNLAISLRQRLRHQAPSGDRPDKPRLLQWIGCIWAVHWKLCLHRMM